MDNNRFKIYRPEGEVKGCVQLLHGMAEYKERYEGFICSLTEHGYACVIHDHLGHGLECDEKDLGFFASDNGWEKLLEDTSEVMDKLKEEYAGKPYVLFGHSMGSIVARTYIQEHPDQVDGMILSGAPNYVSAVSLGAGLSGLIARLRGERYRSHLLENLFTGGFNKGFEGPNQWLSTNQDNVEKYNADKRCGYPFTARAYQDMAKGLGRLRDASGFKVTNCEMPVLFVAGQNDPCTGGEKGLDYSIRTIKDAGYLDVERKLFAGDRHEILNENDKEDVYQYIINWLDSKFE